jgi:hypothetical protein
MTRREAIRQTHQEDTLVALGFTVAEARQLRRISMTLQRWFELECGNSNDYCSYAIERDPDTERPYMVTHSHRAPFGIRRRLVADRETGARKRLSAILAARNTRAIDAAAATTGAGVAAFIQSDPRGAALYILRPGDVPDGADDSAYYSRGICVY